MSQLSLFFAARAASWKKGLRRLCAGYVALGARRSGTLLLCFALLGGLALVSALRLELHSDLAELLPDDHPAVVALRRITPRQISSTNLVLIVKSPDAAANRRYAEALRPSLTALIPSVFSEIVWHPETETAEYAARWQSLYASREDLVDAERLLDRLIGQRSNPLLFDLEGDAEAELRELRKRMQRDLPAKNDAPYFEAKDKTAPLQYLGVLLWRRGDGVATLGDQLTLAAVERVVAAHPPASFHPQLAVEYSGHIAMALAQHDAVRNDLTLATAICVTLVLLSIYLYFRRVAVLFVVGAPAVLGVLCALMLAYFTVRFLNANTAFLISIILGNGINTPIILLARYGEERRAGQAVHEALATALEKSLLATAIATTAASIAYGCLLLTTLRGLSQFGLVGGAGILFVWVLSFLLVPPLVLSGERLRAGMLTPRPALLRAPFLWLGRLVVRRPKTMAGLVLILLSLSIRPMRAYVQDPLEYNFNNLLTRDPEADRRWNLMYELGLGNVGAGYIGRDGVLLADTAEQAEVIRKALWDADQARGNKRLLLEVRTLGSILPQDQDEKLVQLQRLREKIDRYRKLMSDEEWREVQAFRPPDSLRRIGVPDLPRRVRESFTEIDGTVGRLIGIDADTQRFNENDGRELIRLAKAMEVQALDRSWVAASTSTVFAGMLAAIMSDGPTVTLAALLGVTLLLTLAFGRRGAPLVLASLFVGLLWLGALLGTLALKLNFVNFVALSITLGVGADYAANIYARVKSEPEKAHGEGLAQIIADTGSAVALCSLTTVIGYSSLLLSRNRALVSFGQIADLGEITCVISALLVLPLLLCFRSPARTLRPGFRGKPLEEMD